MASSGYSSSITRTCSICKQSETFTLDADPGEGWKHSNIEDCVKRLVTRLDRYEVSLAKIKK